MGWCSATPIFDRMARYVLRDSAASDDERYAVLLELADALEDQDWDCQSDSDFFDDPIVQRVFKELHPDWFDEE